MSGGRGLTVLQPGLSIAQADARYVRGLSGSWAPLDYSSGGPGINYIGTPQWVRLGQLVQVFALISYNPNVSPELAVLGNLPFPCNTENSFNQPAPGLDLGAAGLLIPRLSIAFGGQIHFYLGSPSVRATNAQLSGVTEIPFRFAYVTV